MENLERFKGMTVVTKDRVGNAPFGDVTLTYNPKRTEVYIAIDRVACTIAFKHIDDLRILPILDHRNKRLYLVPDERGYVMRGTKTSKNSRLNFASTPLFTEFKKHKLSSGVSDLIFDSKLNAYYIELN